MKYTDYSKNNLNIDEFREYVQTSIESNEGNTVKNYKVMCELLNEDETTGNSKKAQLNRWKRYFDFYKEGQKFVINEIYDEPFATDDARKRKEGLYVKYIELLLLEYLSKQTDYKVTVGNREMYHILGMTNENYGIRSKMIAPATNEVIRQTITTNVNKFVFTDVPVVSDFNINNFYFRAEQKLNKILYSALNSMKNRFLIDYKKVNLIAELVELENGCNYLDYRESTAYEDKLILEAKKLIISKMGYSNVTEIMLCCKCKEFYNRFNEYVKEHYGWERCYPQLRVVYIDDIAKQIPLKAEEIRKLSYDDKKSQLNAEIIKSLNIQAEKRYEENQNKVKSKCDGEWGDLNKMYDDEPFVYESDYVEIQHALADYLLNIHFEISDTKNEKSRRKDDDNK